MEPEPCLSVFIYIQTDILQSLSEIMSIVGEHMKRSHALALSSAALFLAISAPSYAQTFRAGQQCVPAVADASVYQNCRLHIVQGQEVCRCAIRPQALRRIDRQRAQDADEAVTGSIGSRPAVLPGSGSSGFGNVGSRNSGVAGGTLGTSTSGAVSGGTAASQGGSVADGSRSGRSSAGGTAGASGVSDSGNSGGVSGSSGGGSASGSASSGAGGIGGSSDSRGSGAGGQGNNGNGQGPGNNNGLGNGSEPADNTSTDVKGTDPSNPGGGRGGDRGRGGGDSGRGGSDGGRGGDGGGRR